MSLSLNNKHLAILGIIILAVIAVRLIIADTGTTPLNPGHPLSQTWIDTNLNMGPYLIKVGSATIKGDGTVSTGINAEKVGGYTAADLLAAGGGGCYVSYSGSCLTGFTNKGSAGWWGICNIPAIHFRPPGGGCYGAGASASLNISEAFVCCQ